MYFDKHMTAEELHTRYKQLAKKLHPDIGGNESEFRQMQQEYEDRLNDLLNKKDDKKQIISQEEYIMVLKLLLELARQRKPEIYAKTKIIANAAGDILSLFSNSQAQNISNILKQVTHGE